MTKLQIDPFQASDEVAVLRNPKFYGVIFKFRHRAKVGANDDEFRLP